MSSKDLVLEVVDDLEDVADEWDRLADSTHATPFARPGWLRAWRGAFGARPLVIVTARDAGELVGVLPLERQRSGFRSPTNEHSPEAPLVAIGQDVRRGMVHRILAEGQPVLAFAPLDRSSDALTAFRDVAQVAGYRHLVRTVSHPPYILGRRTLAAFQRAVSRNLRHDVERRLRRLSEVGAVAVQVCDGTDRLEALLDEGFRVESAGWKGAGGTAIASRRSTRDFYSAVARWAARLGWLRVAFLRIDGRPIAFQLDLEANRAYYSLKIGYDPEYARFAPGKVLTYSMVCRAMAHGLSSYELLGSDEPWKERWADGHHELVVAYAFSGSARGRLARSAFVARSSVAGRVPLVRGVAAVLRR
jgi:CelD/BcsL family acetyltransferase involved in cellulose biosynthesis